MCAPTKTIRYTNNIVRTLSVSSGREISSEDNNLFVIYEIFTMNENRYRLSPLSYNTFCKLEYHETTLRSVAHGKLIIGFVDTDKYKAYVLIERLFTFYDP